MIDGECKLSQSAPNVETEFLRSWRVDGEKRARQISVQSDASVGEHGQIFCIWKNVSREDLRENNNITQSGYVRSHMLIGDNKRNKEERSIDCDINSGGYKNDSHVTISKNLNMVKVVNTSGHQLMLDLLFPKNGHKIDDQLFKQEKVIPILKSDSAK